MKKDIISSMSKDFTAIEVVATYSNANFFINVNIRNRHKRKQVLVRGI